MNCRPSSSVMWLHPRLKSTLELHGATCIGCDMGAFGADTKKPTILFGTVPFLDQLGIRVLLRVCL